jgi:DNA-binding CsgD family transcriptional regulator
LGAPACFGIPPLNGRLPIPPPQRTSDESTLTARERDVLELLAKGDLYKEIAETLGISVPTVSTHIRKIYEKLHVHSRAQAVARFIKLPR